MARQETFSLKGKIEVDNKKAVDGVSALNEKVEQTENSVKDLESTSKKQAKTTEKSANKSSKAVGGISKATKGAKKGFQGLGTAMKATGIGLIVGLVASLTQAFRENQAVMDTVNKVMTTISIVTSEVVNGIRNAVSSVSDATNGFGALGKVVKGIITIALTPLKATFFGIKLAIQEAQLLWEKSFFGDGDPKTIKKLNKGITETKNSLKEVAQDAGQAGADIVDNFGKATKEVGQLVSTTVKNVSDTTITSAREQANALIELRKQARLAQTEVERISLINRRDAEIQRQRRDDIRLSIDERIKANEKLGNILEESLMKQKEQAQLQVRLAQLELQRDPQNIERQVQLNEAKNRMLAIEEEIEGFRSEQRMNEAQLQQERKKNLKELQMLGKSELERQKIESQQKLERQRELINRTVQNEKEKNRLLRLAEQEHQNRLDQMERERKEKEAEKRIEELEAKRERDFQNAEAEFQFLKAQKQRIADMEVLTEKQKVNQIAQIEERLTKVKEAKAKQDTKIAKIKNSQEYAMAKDTLAGIGQLIGEQAKANKLIGGAEALINTFKGVTEVWSSKSVLPEPFATAAKVVSTGTTLASGLKAVQQINSTSIPNVPGGSGGGTPTGSGGIGGASAGQASAPDFNIVGQSQGNQIADAIGNQNQNMRAYVVGSEVSNQQELDRQIEEPSRLG